MKNNAEVQKPASVELLGLEGAYQELSIQERDSLGHNFVSLVNTEKGLNIKPVLVQRRAEEDIYLQIKSNTLSDGLLEKVSPEIIQLVLNEMGSYEKSGSELSQKSL